MLNPSLRRQQPQSITCKAVAYLSSYGCFGNADALKAQGPWAKGLEDGSVYKNSFYRSPWAFFRKLSCDGDRLDSVSVLSMGQRTDMNQSRYELELLNKHRGHPDYGGASFTIGLTIPLTYIVRCICHFCLLFFVSGIFFI